MKIQHGAKRDFLVTYDICNASRLRKIHKIMLGHGEPIQYSVFRCFLTPMRKVKLMNRLLETINSTEDQVIIFELGSADTAMTRPIEVLGTAMSNLDQGPHIF